MEESSEIQRTLQWSFLGGPTILVLALCKTQLLHVYLLDYHIALYGYLVLALCFSYVWLVQWLCYGMGSPFDRMHQFLREARVVTIVWTWCPVYLLPEVAPNLTDSCGSPGSDSFDQAFVFHHVLGWCFRKAFGSLTPTTPSQSFRESERTRCSEVSNYSEPEPWLTSDLGKSLGNPSLPTKIFFLPFPWMFLILLQCTSRSPWKLIPRNTPGESYNGIPCACGIICLR